MERMQFFFDHDASVGFWADYRLRYQQSLADPREGQSRNTFLTPYFGAIQ